MSSEILLEPASFRDKNNRVFYRDGAIYRCLSREALEEWKHLSGTAFYARLVREEKVVVTETADIPPPPALASEAPWAGVLRHQPIPYVSYPYEWSFGMLRDAALFQLELIHQALMEDLTLKDASPYNIQWSGSRPVFIDLASFVKWVPGDPWVGYRQFCELFLYPLFLQAYRGVPFQPWLRGSLEGIPVEASRRLWSVRDLLRPGILSHVFLHAFFQKKYSHTHEAIKSELHEAGFHKDLIQSNLNHLDKLVRRLSWRPAGSEWSGYADQRTYSADEVEQKKKFVRDFTRSKPRRLVWDLGCNTGEFSRLAAESASYVVAMDADPWVVETLYQDLRRGSHKNILPLVMNLANPSPAQGWRGLERKTLTERGTPDLTLCLALTHHLVISANVPLDAWVSWLANLKSDLVIEFVGREDPMVQGLLRNKEGRHDDYRQEHFEKLLGQAYTIRQSLSLTNGTRTLYACQAK